MTARTGAFPTPEGLLIEAAVAKTNKHASRESGDTVELAERPTGGLSLVLADGQGSGKAARGLSLLVTAKAVALLKEGVRDGAVARAVADALFAHRHGQVSATLDILSVDLRSGAVLLTRHAETPAVIGSHGGWRTEPTAAGPLGRSPLARPEVRQFPAEPGLCVVVVSDGIDRAGERFGEPPFDVAAFAATVPAGGAQALADALLAEAIRRDRGRPADDMTVVALALGRHRDEPIVRRLAVALPVPWLPKGEGAGDGP